MLILERSVKQSNHYLKRTRWVSRTGHLVIFTIPIIDDWGKIEISVTEFEQSGLIHHFGVISLGIADAICKVPALPAATDSLEICRRTLEDDVTEQYQRPLEFERIENIERFLTTNPTIVNPVILEIFAYKLSELDKDSTDEEMLKAFLEVLKP